MTTLSIVLALVSAALFAVATVLEQRGAMQEPDEEALKPTLLVRLMRRPVWLLGLAADAGGYVVQAAALGVGKIVVVQPLMVASVVFALPLGVKLTGQKIGRREVLAAVAICAGLAIFRFVATPAGGHDDATSGRWIVGFAIVGAAAAALVISSLRRSPSVRAALLGTAGGVIFGLVSALTKSTVDRFGDGFTALVLDWHLYTLIVVAITGFLIVQSSLQTGSLAPALASETVLETITGIVVGTLLLQESLNAPDWGLGVSVLALGTIFCGLVVLSQSQAAARPARARQPALEPAPG